MSLTVGSRLRSQAGSTEVVVIRSPAEPVELTCGGHEMVAGDEPVPGDLAVAPGLDDENLLGKRYTDDQGHLEVLVTKAGVGTLALGGEALALKQAKALPASD